LKPLILHMRACNFFGGPERQVLGHIRHSGNFRHCVLSFIENGRTDELAAECRRQGIANETLEGRSAYELSALGRLRGVFKRLKPAVLCSHGYRPTLLALAAKAGLDLPLIVFSRGHTGENQRVSLFENLEMKALRFADAVVAVSGGYAEHLKRCGVKADSIHVVQNAIEDESMATHFAGFEGKRNELGFGRDDFLIATAGRLSPEKAQGDLITAFAEVQPKYPEAHLLLAGDGPSRGELEAQVEQLAVKNVHFLGFRKDMDAVMCAIDLFVLPSRTEGLPNVALEAFAAKKPVVASAVGGVPEVVEEGVSGCLVPPARPDLLADAILKMLSDWERMQAMGRAGYERVKKDFTFEAQTEKLEGIYRKVIANRLEVRRLRRQSAA